MQPYHDSAPTQTEVYWRPVPAPLAYRPNPIDVSRPGSIAKAAVAGAVAFLTVGMGGGLWLGSQINQQRTAAAIAAAESAKAELTARNRQIAGFCQAATQSVPTPSPEAIAQTPKP